jgi:hypothetical protein
MIQILLVLTAVSSILLNHDVLCEAFPVATGYSRATSVVSMFRDRSSMTALYMHTEDEHGDFFDVESARRQLESLVTGAGGPSLPEKPRNTQDEMQPRPVFSSVVSSPENFSSLPETPVLDVTLPARGPLTTIERERRLAELELLSSLDEGDHSLSDIWDLWFAERGQSAANLLHRVDDLMNEGPEGFGEAEKILRDLVQEHGVHFAEPLNRLATIYYLQGRMEEALTFNKMVLAVKPWHFGALSHIVMVYAALGDNQSARQWAAFRLPSYSPDKSNRRRIRWTERAVAEATMRLERREDTIKKSFGKPDQEWIDMQIQMRHMYENDADAWQ